MIKNDIDEDIINQEELNKLGTSDDDLNQWIDKILNNKDEATGSTTEERINNTLKIE